MAINWIISPISFMDGFGECLFNHCRAFYFPFSIVLPSVAVRVRSVDCRYSFHRCSVARFWVSEWIRPTSCHVNLRYLIMVFRCLTRISNVRCFRWHVHCPVPSGPTPSYFCPMRALSVSFVFFSWLKIYTHTSCIRFLEISNTHTWAHTCICLFAKLFFWSSN